MAILRKDKPGAGPGSDKSCGGTPQIGILLDDVNGTSLNPGRPIGWRFASCGEVV